MTKKDDLLSFNMDAARTTGQSTDNPDSIIHSRNKKDIPVSVSLVSGACAGAVAKTVIAPLDRTKIKFQVSSTPFTYKKGLEVLYKGYKKHGIKSWWRGNSATMARVMPYAAINFTAHEILKRQLGGGSQSQLPPGKRFLAGSLAGATAVCFTYPFDLVRARMAVVGKEQYDTLRHTFTSIYSKEGYKSFYRGFVPTVLGIMPYAGTAFFVYETFKSRYQETHPKKEIPNYWRLAYGSVAGLCGQTLSYPLDIIRRRMQLNGVHHNSYKYNGLLDAVKHVYQAEGLFRGFYKGVTINWVKGPIAVGISFTIFDITAHMIDVFCHEVHFLS